MRRVLLLLFVLGCSLRAVDPPAKEGAGSKAEAKDLDITADEKEAGITKAKQVGIWKVREGMVQFDQEKIFGEETRGLRYAYASQTVGKWTLSVRVMQGSERVSYYLQGPQAFLDKQGAGKYQRWAGAEWENLQGWVKKDGTLKLAPNLWATKDKVFLRVGGSDLTFEKGTVEDLVKSMQESLQRDPKSAEEGKEKTPEPEVKPLPR